MVGGDGGKVVKKIGEGGARVVTSTDEMGKGKIAREKT